MLGEQLDRFNLAYARRREGPSVVGSKRKFQEALGMLGDALKSIRMAVEVIRDGLFIENDPENVLERTHEELEKAFGESNAKHLEVKARFQKEKADYEAKALGESNTKHLEVKARFQKEKADHEASCQEIMQLRRKVVESKLLIDKLGDKKKNDEVILKGLEESRDSIDTDLNRMMECATFLVNRATN